MNANLKFTITRGCGLLLLSAALSSSGATLGHGTASPRNGNLETRFHFSVTYTNPSNGLPSAVYLVLDETNLLAMTALNPADTNTADGKAYGWSGALPKRRHCYAFASTPLADGDTNRHEGPWVSDQPLALRNLYFFLQTPADPDISSTGPGWVRPAGDVNGDGIADLLGIWPDMNLGSNPYEGEVVCHIGPDYTVAWDVPNPAPGGYAHFGQSAASLGDLDGDGCDDLGVISQHNIYYQRLDIFRGQTSAPPALYLQFVPDAALSVVGGADFNRDGYSDLLTEEWEQINTISNVNHATVRYRVRYGPALTAEATTLMGVPLNYKFVNVSAAITDYDRDGYPDVAVSGLLVRLFLTNSPYGTYWTEDWADAKRQFRVARGPNLASVSTPVTEFPDLKFVTCINDLDGDGVVDTAAMETMTNGLKWASGLDINNRTAVLLPPSATNYNEGFFGPGDVTGDGLGDLVVCQTTDSAPSQANVWLYSGTSNSAASPTVLASATGGFSKRGTYEDSWGGMADVDGNGLAEFFTADCGSSYGPLGGSPSLSAGVVQIYLPLYPYPFASSDFPARLSVRLAAATIGFPAMGIAMSQTPNGRLELIAGPVGADGRARFVIPASSVWFPDTPTGYGADTGYLYRRVIAEHDGSGWLTVTGSQAGAVSLDWQLRIQHLQEKPLLHVTQEDGMRLAFTMASALDLSTGKLRLGGRGRLPTLLAAWSPLLGHAVCTLDFEGYVDWVRPAGIGPLQALPATVGFRSVTAGTVVTQKVWLCNYGQTDLNVTVISNPAAPFSLAGLPALPVVVPKGGSLAVDVRYAPTATGRYTSAVSIVSNDPQQPTQWVSLEGTALPAGAADLDGDGMADDWEQRYGVPTVPPSPGLSTNEDEALLDYDHDGTSNLDEFYSGMNPTDPASVFRITAGQRAAGTNFIVSWLSATNKSYRVWSSANLHSGFSLLRSGISATPPTNIFTDSSAPPNPARFYRIEVLP